MCRVANKEIEIAKYIRRDKKILIPSWASYISSIASCNTCSGKMYCNMYVGAAYSRKIGIK